MVSHHSLSRKLLSVSSLLQPAQIQTVLETGRSILPGSHLASIIQASVDIHEVLGREENRNTSSTPSYEGAYSQELAVRSTVHSARDTGLRWQLRTCTNNVSIVKLGIIDQLHLALEHLQSSGQDCTFIVTVQI